MSALRELLVSFGIEVDDHELKEGHKAAEGFLGKLKEVASVAAEAFAIGEIKEFVQTQIEAAAQLKDTAVRIGTTAQELQAMDLAAGQAGVSNEGLAVALRFLNKNLAEAVGGGGEASKVFSELGIAVKNADGSTRAAGDVMGDLADYIASIQDPARQTEVAMKLLGRGGAELIPLLREGGKAFDEARQQMQDLGGGMSDEFVDQAKETDDALVRLKFATTGLKSAVAGTLLPVFAQVVEWMTKGVAAIRQVTKETHILQSAFAFFGTLGALKALGSMSSLLKVFGLLQPTIGGTVVSLLRFAAPAALIAGLYLVFDDLYTLMHGGESVIGDTLDELFGFGTATEFAKDFNDALDASIDLMGNLGSIIKNVVLLAVEEVFDALKAVGSALGDLAGGNFAEAWKTLSKGGAEMDADMNKRFGAIGSAAEGVGEDFTLNKEGRRRKRVERGDVSAMPKPGDAAFVGPANPHAAAGPPLNIYGHPFVPPVAVMGPKAGAGDVHLHQHNETKVDVHTSSDAPRAVGDAVGAGVATATQRANDRARTALRKP